MNQLLDIPGNTAVQLTAEQIMKLVCFMTNDNDLNWLFMVDINLFIKMVQTIQKTCPQAEKLYASMRSLHRGYYTCGYA